MRYAMLALIVLSGCYGESVRPPREPYEYPGPGGSDVSVDPSIHGMGGTSQLASARLRAPAKTIEWERISTEEGAAYLAGAVVVDRIFRDDAEDVYGVRVRLKNTTDKPLTLEYLIRFYTRSGARLASNQGGVGASEQWKGFTIEPYRVAVVDDFARVGGAEGFKLQVRAAGGQGDGAPDAKK